MKRLQKPLLILLLSGSLLGLLGLAWTRIANEPLVRSRLMMGTVIEITVYGRDSETAIAAAFKRIQQIETTIGRGDFSDLNRLAAHAGGPPLKVSDDTWRILSLASEYWRKTEGAFDVTVGPLVELWGFGYDGQGNIPEAAAIKTTLPKIGSDKLLLFPETKEVKLAKPGMSLTVGGIAKGYAIEEAAKVLMKNGVTSAMINAGSSIKVIGDGPGGRGWRIGVEDPRRVGRIRGLIILRAGEAIGTSADNHRFFIKDSQRYSHLIDPHTGYPGEGKMALVTVITRNAATADIITKALFLNNLQWSLAFLKKQRLKAVFIEPDGTIHTTPGFKLR